MSLSRRALLSAAALAPIGVGLSASVSNAASTGALVNAQASNGAIATFTVGARTVTMAAPVRTLSEPGVAAIVSQNMRVRFLPQPFTGTVDYAWLNQQAASSAPDLFAIAFEYVAGGPKNASYGPLQADGTRQEGSDFNDYLGVSYTYPDGSKDAPEAAQKGCLDCSGFVRMVTGYRMGVPISLDAKAGFLPRRAVDMASAGPGVTVIANTGSTPSNLAALRPGDLLFWDAATDDGTAIDHVGFYLGLDSAGKRRFLSSRKSADGPTMGDVSGRSLLDYPSALYTTSFRAARRI